MLSRSLVSLIAGIIALSSLSQAAPAPIEERDLVPRDVWAPKILYPREMIIWKSGYRHNITWDTSTQPEQVTNPTGKIQLRKDNFTQPAVLAEGFQLSDGRVEITVPYVQPGCGYQLVLIGDSGNFSPEFIIASEGD